MISILFIRSLFRQTSRLFAAGPGGNLYYKHLALTDLKPKPWLAGPSERLRPLNVCLRIELLPGAAAGHVADHAEHGPLHPRAIVFAEAP